MKILIVDDQQTAREELAGHLGSHETFFATDGEEALSRIEEVKPDLVFLDVLMPGRDGFNVCRRIRRKASASVRDVPVVMVSSKDTAGDKEMANMQGASGYITKPYSGSQITQAVAQYAQ